MVTQEELNKFVKEFNDEDPALVNEALEECIKLNGRDNWHTMFISVRCWIAGWKKRDGPYFTIDEIGWAGKIEHKGDDGT